MSGHAGAMLRKSLSLLCLTFINLVSSQENVTVLTSKGPVVGLRVSPNPATGVSYDAFLGIPYGKATARFQVAVPPEGWTLPRLAQADGPPCPQIGLPYSEDCLFINVFTPMNCSASGQKLPVMTYIHGSAFTFSSSYSRHLGPDFLVNASVILVTMNYRLGAIGFLSLGSKMAPGNLGLHDTWLALQWVRDEISAFGGDPAQVTLFGHSAGSAMTQFHYLSDFTSGLFARAVAQSGSALAPWSMVPGPEAARRARLLAARVGCQGDDASLLTCLQATHIGDIVSNQTAIQLSDRDLASGNIWPFVPVLDDHTTSDKPFFNDSLSQLMQRALARAKPLITGFTTDEGIYKFADKYWWLAEGNLAAFTPAGVSDERRDMLVSSIKSLYYPDKPDLNKVESIIRLNTDYRFSYPSIQMSRYFANYTYGYLFAYDGSWVPTPGFFAKYKMRGVSHGDELFYLFLRGLGTQFMDACPLNTANLEMMQRMVRWWTSFAKTGVPDTTWGKISEAGYRRIDSTLSTMNSSEFETLYYDFWATVESSTTNGSSSNIPYNILLLFIILCGFSYIHNCNT